MEVDIVVRSMDPKPLPKNAVLHTWKPTMYATTENAGYASDCIDWMKQEIEDAGFINVHEIDFKLPTGDWSSHPVWKEAGRLSAVLYKVSGFRPESAVLKDRFLTRNSKAYKDG